MGGQNENVFQAVLKKQLNIRALKYPEYVEEQRKFTESFKHTRKDKSAIQKLQQEKEIFEKKWQNFMKKIIVDTKTLNAEKQALKNAFTCTLCTHFETCVDDENNNKKCIKSQKIQQLRSEQDDDEWGDDVTGGWLPEFENRDIVMDI